MTGRIRTIKPEAPQSESLGRCCRDSRLLFFMLFTVADDEGRGRAASRLLASLLFPYDDDAPMKIPEWLMELERENCVIVYCIDGNTYFQITNWAQHQKVDKATKSKLPAPPERKKSRERSAKPREGSSNSREGSSQYLDLDQEGIKDTSSLRSDVCAEPSADAEAAAPPPIVTIPTSGKGGEYPVSEAQADEFQALYPGVDVRQQLRAMRGWSLANPTRRKTARGMPKFINSWLSREQDKAGSKPNQRAGPAKLGFVDLPPAEDKAA